MLAPVTTDPAAGADELPEGAPAAAVVIDVIPGADVFGLVLEHPATTTAITTIAIAMKLIPEIFKLPPPVYN
jgi:hypothetical protein